MLKQRILTALVGLPLLIYVLLYGSSFLLAPFFAAFIGLSVWEIVAMILPRFENLFVSEETRLNHIVPRLRAFDLVLCLSMALLIFAAHVFLEPAAAKGVIIAVLLFSIVIGVMLAQDIATAMGHALGYVMSLVYGVLPWLLIWDLCLRAPHSRYLILLLAIVWCGDTGGYFGGRFFGHRKLAPRLSPKKTWEGAVAGILASMLGGYLANVCWSYDLATTPQVLLLALLGGFAGQLGDLVESAFKRFARIKDSGVVFPGHGGFLDRCDGLLFAAPVVWILLDVFKQF